MKKGDIVLFKFPFSNLVGYKKRPCIVLSENINGDILLCQITSIKPKDNYLTITNESFDNESYIKINKITTADISRIDKVIGSIKNNEYELLAKMINRLIGN